MATLGEIVHVMPASRVLLVAYHFPPIAGSGVQRALKLARYLPDENVHVDVLTSKHTHYPLLDDSLESEISGDPRISVHRISGFDPGGLANRMTPGRRPHRLSRAISAVEKRIYWRLQSAADRWAMPEPEQWWIGSAVRAARRLHDRRRFDALITTSPPHSCQRIGLELQRVCNLPWIADLRDPIVDNFAYAPRNDATHRYWGQLERDIVGRADSIVVTCPDYATLLAHKHDIEPSRLACITNGYDEADRPEPYKPASKDAFVLAHIGAFYQSQSIEPLLAACREVRERRPSAALNLRLVGSVSRQQSLHFQDADAEFVEHVGYLRHADALADMQRADALFLMTPTHPNGRNCIPAKLFEYLAFGRHIIALVHRDSSVDRLLRDAGVRHIAFHDDPATLSRHIEAAHDAWQIGKTPTSLNPHVVERYRRDRLASEYAHLVAAVARASVVPCAADGACG